MSLRRRGSFLAARAEVTVEVRDQLAEQVARVVRLTRPAMHRGWRKGEIKILSLPHQFLGQRYRGLEGYDVVLHAVDDQEMILKVTRVLRRAALECVRAAVGATHDRDVVVAEEVWIHRSCAGDSGFEQAGFFSSEYTVSVPP